MNSVKTYLNKAVPNQMQAVDRLTGYLYMIDNRLTRQSSLMFAGKNKDSKVKMIRGLRKIMRFNGRKIPVIAFTKRLDANLFDAAICKALNRAPAAVCVINSDLIDYDIFRILLKIFDGQTVEGMSFRNVIFIINDTQDDLASVTREKHSPQPHAYGLKLNQYLWNRVRFGIVPFQETVTTVGHIPGINQVIK